MRQRAPRAIHATRGRSIRGGLAYAQRLLAKPVAQDGFTRLQQHGRLDLAVEALVLDLRFRSLFTPEELAEAQRRLVSVGDLTHSQTRPSTASG